MIRNTVAIVSGLALALWLPTLGFAGPDGSDDHGKGDVSQVDDHGKDGQPDDHGTNTGQDDHGVNSGQDDHGVNSGQDDHGVNSGQDDHGKDGNSTGADDHGAANNAARLRVPLAVTQVGTEIAAEGKVEIRVRNQQQRFKVEVEADVPNGTMFNVIANGNQVGTITSQFGEAELELESEEGRPLPVGLSATAISVVEVKNLSGRAVLQAQFGPIDANAAATNVPAVQGRRKVALVAAPAGLAIRAEGQVETRVLGSQQTLKVEVEEANVPDGTMFDVFANGIRVGAITINFGTGELEIQSETTVLPAGLTIDAIKTVSVTSGSTPILEVSL